MPRKKATLCFWCESEYDPKTFKCTKLDGVIYWICDKCTEWSVQTHMKIFLEQHPDFHKRS